MKDFSERLRESRVKKGLTQAELGKQLGFRGNTAIYRFENGQSSPGIPVLVGLAKVLGVDLHWLITGTKCPEINNLKKVLEPCVQEYLKKTGELIEKYQLRIFELELGQSLRGEQNEKDIASSQKGYDELKSEYQNITNAMRNV